MKAALAKFAFVEDQREQFLVRQRELEEEEERAAQQRLLEAQNASQASAEPSASQAGRNGRKHAHGQKAKTPVK